MSMPTSALASVSCSLRGLSRFADWLCDKWNIVLRTEIAWNGVIEPVEKANLGHRGVGERMEGLRNWTLQAGGVRCCQGAVEDD